MNRLDLKALRIGLHGWWLGNPLVYKPGAADLVGIARELASAGAASGTLVLSNTADVATMSDERVEAILILRPPIARTLSGESVARSIAAVIETTFERPYLIQEGQGQWDVVTGAGSPPADVCHVHVDAAGQNDVVFVGLRLDLGRLWMTAQRLERDGGQPVALLARPDWREVLLARILHALDVSLAV